MTGPVADRDERAGASPTTTTAILALQRRAGNRAVGRWLNGRPARRLQRKEQTLPVDAGQSIRYDDELVGEQEVKRLWTKLRTDLRARVDPKSAAELYRVGKKNVAERSLGFARLPVAAETLDVAQAAMVWSYAELAGLEQALDVARRIPALAKRDPGAVVFGKVTTLLDFKFRAVPGDPGKKKQYEQYALPAGSSEHAETVIPDKGGVMSVVLSGSCVGMNTPFTSTGKSMDPLAETGDRARASHEYEIRARRMAWVHELGHTLYPAYKAEWERLVTGDVKKSEGSPTGYAAEKPAGEEDFCESFMVLTLYGGFKELLGPTRTKFFERHPELRVPAASAVPKPALAKV